MSVVFESYSFSQVNKLEFAQAVEIKGFMKAVRKPGFAVEFLSSCENDSYNYFPSIDGSGKALCYASHTLDNVNLLFFYDLPRGENFLVIQNTMFVSAIFFPDRDILIYGSKDEVYYRDILNSSAKIVFELMKGADLELPKNYYICNGYPRPYHYFYDHMPTILKALKKNSAVSVVTYGDIAFFSGSEIEKLSGAGCFFDAQCVDDRSVIVFPGLERKYAPDEKVSELKSSLLSCSNGVLGKAPEVNADFYLWVGVCSEKRVIVNLLEAISFVIDSAIKKYEKIVVFCDGMTRPVSVDRDKFRDAFCQSEVDMVNELSSCYPGVEVVDLVGAKATDKIECARVVDYFFSNALTDSIWCSTFFDKPGLAYCSPRAELSLFCHKNTSILSFKGVSSKKEGANFAYDDLLLNISEIGSSLSFRGIDSHVS